MQVERFVTRALRASLAAPVIAVFAVSLASAGTLDQIKESGHIKLGYYADAPPFTHRADGGAVEGYSAALCKGIADQVKTQLALPELTVDWVPVALDSGLSQVQPGSIDILCTPISATLTRRRDVSFSIPVYPGGVRAAVRADSPPALREALAEKPSVKPVWRGSPAATVLGQSTFAVVSGSTSESMLKSRLNTFQIDAKVVSVPDYRTALQQLREGKAQVVFGDHAILLGAMDSESRDDFVILDRLMTNEPYALALPRNDDDFRLLVDRSLSQFYVTNGFRTLYTQSFGEFSENTQVFFRWMTPTP